MKILLVQRSTQRHGGAFRPEHKPREQSVSECGVEGVEVGQLVRGDCVEGQRTSRTVHKHCYSPRRGGPGLTEGGLLVIMPNRETIFRAGQTPGLIIVSKHTVKNASFPCDSSVRH
ncbi:hypothetical protein NL108_006954 [Boleophthalmus pectinirostris]|nr:hypothetical protein NL108_006954 [Boleophthalmus pectinirostris]